MSNLAQKLERLRARVCGIRKDHGRVNVRLTTPARVGAFFVRGVLPRRKGAHHGYPPNYPVVLASRSNRASRPRRRAWSRLLLPRVRLTLVESALPPA